MRRAAWINQVLAAWMIGFMVFGLGDSASASEILSHGGAALFLLVASWLMLMDPVGPIGLSTIQILAGGLLCATPLIFHYSTHSFVLVNDLTVGAVVLIDGAIELCELWMRGGTPRLKAPRAIF